MFTQYNQLGFFGSLRLNYLFVENLIKLYLINKQWNLEKKIRFEIFKLEFIVENVLIILTWFEIIQSEFWKNYP